MTTWVERDLTVPVRGPGLVRAAVAYCAADIGFQWKGPEYRERERTAPQICGHLEANHKHGICYDCDDLDQHAGMMHAFIPGGTKMPVREYTPLEQARQQVIEAILEIVPSTDFDGERSYSGKLALGLDGVHGALDAYAEAIRHNR